MREKHYSYVGINVARVKYDIISLWLYTRHTEILRMGHRDVSKLKTYGIAVVRNGRSKTNQFMVSS